MGADGGKNRLQTVAIVLVDIAGEFAGAGVLAALVWRNGKDAMAPPSLARLSMSRSFNCFAQTVLVIELPQRYKKAQSKHCFEGARL